MATSDQEATTADYLRVLRHELRTPCNHIIGYSEMLIEEADDEGLDTLGAELREIHALGRQILLRIGDALDPARIESHTPDLQQTRAAVEPLLDQIIATIARIDGLIASAGRPATAQDVAKIGSAAQHLRHLLANGVDPHPAGGDAHPPAVEPPHADSHDHRPRGSASGRILVVDDNANNRDMLMRRLERLGYTVAGADDGRAGVEALRAAPFDLLLLDIMMPEMNGFQVLETIQSDPELRRVPVIVLSALDEIESVARCIEMGAQDYLPKPFDPVLLNARIGACLEKKRLSDQEHDYLHQIEREKKRSDALLNVVIPIGAALSAEKHFDRLLEKIVVEAMGLCSADGGTLYLRTDDDTLRFVIVRNRSLGIALGGTSRGEIPFPPIPMYRPGTREPESRFVVTRAAGTGRSINVPDTYESDEFDFSGTHRMDAANGYRSVSVLAVPLRDEIGRVIGVLQLINAQDPQTGRVSPFDEGLQQMIESLSALASAALAAYDREQRLRQQIEDLKIEIDEVKKQKQVSEIVETDYFQTLQREARRLRDGRSEPRQDDAAQYADDRRLKSVYRINDQNIYVYEQGPQRGQVALLIHGWSSSWFAMSPLLPILGRYRCLAVDLPGYGDSPPLPVRATIGRYVDLLAALIRETSPGRPVVVVGHSMGGMISLTLALRYPDLVERMVLLCPTISGRLSTRINLSILPITMLERIDLAGKLIARLEPQLLGITDFLMRPVSFAERSGITERAYKRIRADVRRPGQGRVRAECFWAMRGNSLAGKIGKASPPSLVVWGMEDNTVPLRDASIIADEWPQAELRVIPKAGHWPQFETPELTLRYVRGFLSTPTKLLKAQF